MAESGAILVYHNRLKVFILQCPTILILVGMNWLRFGTQAGARFALDDPQLATVLTIAVVGVTVVGVLVLVYGNYSAFKPEPYLLVNQVGIYMNDPLVHMSVPWTEIETLTTGPFLGLIFPRGYFLVMPRRPTDLLARLNRFQRFMMKGNLRTFQGAIPVSNSFMSIHPTDLLTQIGHQYSDAIEHHGVRLVD
jgi:hypothetical protein